MGSDKFKRWVEAPRPQGFAQRQGYAVRGVYLGEREVVEWIWTHVDGGSFVSGYRIIHQETVGRRSTLG